MIWNMNQLPREDTDSTSRRVSKTDRIMHTLGVKRPDMSADQLEEALTDTAMTNLFSNLIILSLLQVTMTILTLLVSSDYTWHRICEGLLLLLGLMALYGALPMIEMTWLTVEKRSAMQRPLRVQYHCLCMILLWGVALAWQAASHL